MKEKTTAKRPAAKAAPELDDALFERRLVRHYDELKWLYCELYHGDIAASTTSWACSAGAGPTGRRTCASRMPAGRPTPTGTAAGTCWA